MRWSLFKHSVSFPEQMLRVSGYENHERIGDVIFVHGLDGDQHTTWHPAGKPEMFWPAILGRDLPQIGVWSLGYDAHSLLLGGYTMPLFDRANNILALLEANLVGFRPTVFVCHSLGGLLVKQMLRNASTYSSEAWQRISLNARAIVFLSTPHAGSGLASWLQYVHLLLPPSSRSVVELQRNAPELRDLNLWYRNVISENQLHIANLVFCETRPTGDVCLVVDPTSADPGLKGVVPIPVDADHISICKPASKNALVYKLVDQFVRKNLGITNELQAVSVQRPLERLADVNHNLPPRVYGKLLGRERELSHLIKGLGSPLPVITIEGFAGIGKTSLAIETGYACLLKTTRQIPKSAIFDCVVWVPVRDKQEQNDWLVTILDTIARLMDFHAIAQASRERKKLEIDNLLRSHKILLILDKFESAGGPELTNWIENVPEPSKVLITSRRHQFERAWSLDLKGLQTSDAVQLIRQQANALGLTFCCSEWEDDLVSLCKVTGGNPEAIALSLGLVRKGHTFQGLSHSLGLNDPDQVVDSPDMAGVFDNLFSWSWNLLSHAAKRVLVVAPLFVSTRARSIRREALLRVSGLSEADFERAVVELLDLKLLEIDYWDRGYIIHALTRTFAKSKLNDDPRFEIEARNQWSNYYLEFVRKNVLRDIPSARYWNCLVSDKMKAVDREWPNINEVIEWAARTERTSLFIDFVMILVHYMDSRFLNSERLHYVSDAADRLKILQRKEDEALLRTDALAWTCIEEGRFDEAENQISIGLKILEQLPSGAECSLHDLGLAWMARVKSEKNLLAEAAELLAKTLTKDREPWIASRIKVVGGDLMLKNGNSPRALEMYSDAGKMLEEYGGEGHGYQIEPRVGLALLADGHIDEAEKLFAHMREQEQIVIGRLYGDYGLALVALRRGDKLRGRKLMQGTRKQLLNRTSSNSLLKLIDKSFRDLDQVDLKNRKQAGAM